MGKEYTPLFHNEMGVEEVVVGVRHFGCMGALPPMDHPHVYLEIASEDTVTCPYCSTRYRFDPELDEKECRPAEALYKGRDAA